MPLFYWYSNYLSFNAKCHNSESQAGWQSSLSPRSGAGPKPPFSSWLKETKCVTLGCNGKMLTVGAACVGFSFSLSWPLSNPSPSRGSHLLAWGHPGAVRALLIPHGEGRWSPPAQSWLPLAALLREQGRWGIQRFYCFCLLINLAAWSWVRKTCYRDFMCPFLTKQEQDFLAASWSWFNEVGVYFIAISESESTNNSKYQLKLSSTLLGSSLFLYLLLL